MSIFDEDPMFWDDDRPEQIITENLSDIGFDERSLDELLMMDLQDRWRELLADADELIDRETENG